MKKKKSLRDFPKDLRQARKKRKLSQEYVAEYIHRTPRQLQHIETDGAIPRADAFVLGCDFMGVHPMEYMNFGEPSDEEEEEI